MRPFVREHVGIVKEITARFPRVHGAPLHEGPASALGITDLTRPDFGEPMEILSNEVPLYWGCGLTALTTLQASGIPLFITHAPGAMLVTDIGNVSLMD